MHDQFDADALLTFLDYLSDKGLGKPETIKSRKIAVGRVVDTLGYDEFDDLRSIDVDLIMERFFNKEATKFSPGSMTSYKSRVNTAVSDFLRYRENPSGFKVLGQRKSRIKRQNDSGERQVDAGPSSMTAQPSLTNGALKRIQENERGIVDALDLPIPIREGLVIKISGLPFDLKRSEAQRIANVVLAMSLEE